MVKTCEICLKQFKPKDRHYERHRCCGKECGAILRRSGTGVEFNGRWFSISTCDGYYKAAHGGPLLHREIYKHHYGSIPQGYVVHHKNGNKIDNSIENLEAIPKADHDTHHMKERWRNKRSIGCVKKDGPLPMPREA